MYVRVTPITAVLATSALCISLAVHVANMFALWPRNIEGVLKVNDIFELPIRLRSASLTTLKSHRMGLYANGSDLMPAGYGFVYNPERGEHWFVAHYHQLHCLHALRTSFLSRDELSNAQLGHVDHCFMYLHQALLCNVDVTLEPATHMQKTAHGKLVNAVTGFGVTHRCRDWGQLRRYMEDNYDQWAATYDDNGDGQGV